MINSVSYLINGKDINVSFDTFLRLTDLNILNNIKRVQDDSFTLYCDAEVEKIIFNQVDFGNYGFTYVLVDIPNGEVCFDECNFEQNVNINNQILSKRRR